MQNAVGRFSERGIVGRSFATPNLISAEEEGSPAALNSEKSGGRFSASLAKQMVREDLTTMGRGIRGGAEGVLLHQAIPDGCGSRP